MKSVIIVMSLLGCSDDAGQCQIIDTVSGTWPTIEACQADQHDRLTTLQGEDWPVLMATCQDTAATAVAAVGSAVPAPVQPAKASALEPPFAAAEAPDRQAGSAIPGIAAVRSAVTWMRDGSVLVMQKTTDLARRTGRYGLDLITGNGGS